MDEVERWVSRGRQLVDGVAGARPGTRANGRVNERRPAVRPTLDSLGRWVENKIDWLLEDGDDWREPWQEQEPPGRAAAEPARPRRRLDAVSRRGRPPAGPDAPPAQGPAAETAESEGWPDDAAFTLPRWQRGQAPERGGGSGADVPPSSIPASSPAPSSLPPSSPAPGSGGRPLPRSSRRRG